MAIDVTLQRSAGRPHAVLCAVQGNDHPPVECLKKDLIATVRKAIGAIAAPDVIHWVSVCVFIPTLVQILNSIHAVFSWMETALNNHVFPGHNSWTKRH